MNFVLLLQFLLWRENEKPFMNFISQVVHLELFKTKKVSRFALTTDVLAFG